MRIMLIVRIVIPPSTVSLFIPLHLSRAKITPLSFVKAAGNTPLNHRILAHKTLSKARGRGSQGCTFHNQPTWPRHRVFTNEQGVQFPRLPDVFLYPMVNPLFSGHRAISLSTQSHTTHSTWTTFIEIITETTSEISVATARTPSRLGFVIATPAQRISQ